MKFKKIIAFILCAIMVFSLAACNKDVRGGADPDGPFIPGPGPDPGSEIDYDTQYTVTFDANGGTVTPATKKAYKNQTIDPPRANYPGYVFEGWFMADGKTQFTSSTKVTGDITVTARWASDAQMNEEARQYESTLTAANGWQSGHLYIHYKRYNHVRSEEGTRNSSAAPNYDDAINSAEYGDRGLWLWPKKGEGRLFNPAWIDVSGAVYDILVDHEYTDAGWDEKTKTDKGLHINYSTVAELGMQMFSIKSRKQAGFWANDGGNNFITLADMRRKDGTYHWFVTQGRVGSGSVSFAAEEVKDPYADIPAGTATTKISGTDIINSNAESSYKQITDRVTGWEDDAVGYQIFIASFCDGKADDANTPVGTGMGDIKGIISKLDYLDSLNVDVLWLTPFQESTNYHGYDIKDYYSVDPRFGTLAEYRELVYEVHKRGMKIVMDFVLNHTSQANPWFVKSQNLEKEGDIDYRNFYNWINETQYNELDDIEKEQWYKDEYGYYFYSSFSSDQPELNYDYQPVRDAILEVCDYWMAFGLDGFRLDAVKHIYMKNEVKGPGRTPSSDVLEDGEYSVDLKRNYNFYREFNYRLKTKHPNAYVVGENLTGNPAQLAPYYQGIDSQFNFNLYYDMSRTIAQSTGLPYTGSDGRQQTSNADWTNIFGKFETGHNLYKDRYANYIDGQFTSNHDLPRARNRVNINGTIGDDDTYGAFYTTRKIEGTEAQIDTNAVTKSETLLGMYYAALMTLPGISWIYYGDELGMDGIMQYSLDHPTGSTSSTASSPHEDMIYRQPMKWKASGNAEYAIGFENKIEKLVGLNTTSYVKSVAESSTYNASTHKYTFTAGTILDWTAKLTNIRRQYGLGIATLVRDNGSNNAYIVTGRKGKIKVSFYFNESSKRTGGIASWGGSVGSGKYSGVVISAA